MGRKKNSEKDSSLNPSALKSLEDLQKVLNSTVQNFPDKDSILEMVRDEAKDLKPDEVDLVKKALELMLADPSMVFVDTSELKYETPQEYKKSKKQLGDSRDIPFQNKFFCRERIQDIFHHAGYKSEKIFDQEFLVENELGQILYVRILDSKPIVRLIIPAFFRRQQSVAKKRQFCCDIMQEYPFIRVAMDQDSDVYFCVDYQYINGINCEQLLTCAEILIADTTFIYTENNKLLDMEMSGLIPLFDGEDDENDDDDL